jgi:MYXO-CTERM domain-containing protein
MNAKTLLVACTAVVGSAAAANATLPIYTLNWLVNGQESVVVNEGDLVLVTGIASWTPAAHGLGSTQFRVELMNADASDDLTYAELGGLGRNVPLRMMPQMFQDGPIGGGWEIEGLGGGVIDAAQLPQMFNPGYTSANPVEVFRFEFIAGDAGRTIDIDSPIQNVNIYANAMGTPTLPYEITTDGARIQVVPAPGAAALVGLGGLVSLRRRRRN